MKRYPERGEASGAGTPASVEFALRRVRLLACLLVGIRLLLSDALPVLLVVGLSGAFLAMNGLSRLAERQPVGIRRTLGIVQLVAGTVFVLLVVWVQPAKSDSADWVILVLPVIEGAIRFNLPGAFISWAVLAGGSVAWNYTSADMIPFSSLAQRLTVVFLVALPTGFLAEHLADEIAAHRRGRDEAERRGVLLRAAALGGRESTRLDVDEILGVLRGTVADMGFADPQVFELIGDTLPRLTARPVRYSRDVLAIAPGDPRLLVADTARRTAGPATWPPEAAAVEPLPRRGLLFGTRRRHAPAPPKQFSALVAVPVTGPDDAEAIVLTARWPGPGVPPESQRESLELFAAQAGASLSNAQAHRELQEIKDRLAHEASHDSLTDLPNRRRFHEQLERMCGRGRAGDQLGVLFLDLDGFKEVNDRFGHDTGNELLISVAKRLERCVRPGDVVARMGGDEFTIMLTRIESAAPAIEVADRVCQMLTEPFTFGPHEVRISTSIGIALAAADTADAGDLVRRADVAMYRAKSQGKAGWAMDPGSLEPAESAPVEN